MSIFPFGILFAVGMLMSAVFGTIHWAMAWEEGWLWGCLALIPLFSLAFTIRFWHQAWVRRCFLAGAVSLSVAIANLICLILNIPNLPQSLQAYRKGDSMALIELFTTEAWADEQVVTPAEPTPAPTPFDRFSDGVAYATEAAKLAQTAETQADWEQVASNWEYAAAMMAAVPTEHPRFVMAQVKVTEYEKNRATIQRERQARR